MTDHPPERDDRGRPGVGDRCSRFRAPVEAVDGGEIWVDSGTDEGTTFSLSLSAAGDADA